MSSHLIELMILGVVMVAGIVKAILEMKKEDKQKEPEPSAEQIAQQRQEFRDRVKGFFERFERIVLLKGLRPKTRREWIWNITLGLCGLGMLYFFFPLRFSWLIYQVLFAGFFHILPIVLGLAIFVYAGRLFVKGKGALSLTYLAAAIMIGLTGWLCIGGLEQWRLCQDNPFVTQTSPPVPRKSALCFTPDTVAWNDMLQEFGSSDLTIELDRVRPVDWKGGYGYVAPITPDGLVNRWKKKVDGYMVFDDNPGVAGKRVTRITQPCVYGEDMMFFDNIWRQLYLRDPFCKYGELHYVQLVGSEEIVALAPRTRYRLKFPCMFIPYFAGVTLVHSDGQIEVLSAAEAKEDTRLTGKQIFPKELARQIVASQVYDQGLILGLFRKWYTPAKMIRVATVAHSSQFPYYTPLESGDAAWYVAAEPAGQSYARFRDYYVGVSDGSRKVYAFDPDAGILGPERALQRVHSISGRRWVNPFQSQSTGDFRVVHATNLIRDDELYWKYTVTTAEYVSVVLTAVVDTQTHQVSVFHSRATYEAWLDGADAPEEAAQNAKVEQLKQKLEDALNVLEELNPPE